MKLGWEIMTVYGLLVAFGIGYNRLIEWLEEEGYDRGYTAILVIGGTMITLLGAAALIGLEAALITFGCFAMSGLPMTVGSMLRNARLRREDEDRQKVIIREELMDGNQTADRWVRLETGGAAGNDFEPGGAGSAAENP